VNLLFNPPTPLGLEWQESSKRYTDLFLALCEATHTHPGFFRVLPEALQLAIARRLLNCLGLRNPVIDIDPNIRCPVPLWKNVPVKLYSTVDSTAQWTVDSTLHSTHGTRWRAACGLWESCGRLAAERVTARADLPGWHMLEIGNE
jgi:hypothetical protein